jgi:hypothetical protein
MSKVEIDGVSYDVAPEVAGLLQAVSEERDELRDNSRPLDDAGSLPKAFLNDLTVLINTHSIENMLDMPDYILAAMICRMLEAIGPCIKKTLDWHGCDSVCHPSPNTKLTGGLPAKED